MTSNMFSRLIPGGGGRSFYDELRARNDEDIEDRAGLLDEENLNHDFHDYDLDNVERLAVDDSRQSLAGGARRATRGGPSSNRTPKNSGRSKWLDHDEDGDNNEVPESLLVEPQEMVDATHAGHGRKKGDRGRQAAIPGPSTRKARSQWETTQYQQKLHQEDRPRRDLHDARPGAIMAKALGGDARKKAEWMWTNVTNLDNFMHDVYAFYQGGGFWCILLERFLHLVNASFVAVFLTFMTQCVNYSKIRKSKTMSEIVVPQCTQKMSGLWNLGLWLFTLYFVFKVFFYITDMRRLFAVRDFYVHLLNVPEDDMQTITWQEVVGRIMALRDYNPKTAVRVAPEARKFMGSQSKERLDASDIANRIMRRENYLIALFNKDILDLKVSVPFLGSKELLSKTLEWAIWFSIIDFVFNAQGQVNQEFLKADRRRELSAKLRGRFVFSATMNLISAPFLVCYLVIVYFLTYYQEYQKNPSTISARMYTPLARWKFREFNELPHLFERRLNLSHPYAAHYIDQFPKAKTEQVFRTVAFISGSLVTVLAIATLVDPEMFLSFEITHDRTVLFYISVLGAIWAFSHGSISQDNNVFDPEYALRNVIEYTHYEPDHWKGQLHSYEVKKEFSELYNMKLIIFAAEIMSIIVAPFMLLVTLPRSSDQIIDFFREFTIHVDGLGYVCSFAEFDFKKGVGHAKKPAADGTPADVRDDYYATKHGKMEASYYGFIGNYGNYMLDPKTGSHLPPGLRHQFNPPPAWPTMNSPTLGAGDMQASRMGGRGERARSRTAARTPRYGPPLPLPSPMGSILLDPHHQPPVPAGGSSFGNKSMHRPRRGHMERNIIEESAEDEALDDGAKDQEDEEAYGGSGAGLMDESTWQTSPTKLSRENSAVVKEEPVAGVVGMIYQFNQAQLNRRPGGVR